MSEMKYAEYEKIGLPIFRDLDKTRADELLLKARLIGLENQAAGVKKRWMKEAQLGDRRIRLELHKEDCFLEVYGWRYTLCVMKVPRYHPAQKDYGYTDEEFYAEQVKKHYSHQDDEISATLLKWALHATKWMRAEMEFEDIGS